MCVSKASRGILSLGIVMLIIATSLDTIVIHMWPGPRFSYLLKHFLNILLFFAGLLGQLYISGWPRGPAKDLLQPEAAHDLLWPKATTK